MKLLIAGTWMPTPSQHAALEGMGHEVHLLAHEASPLPLAAEEVEGVVCNNLFIHHPMAAFSALRYIQLTSVGCERIPMAEVWGRRMTLHTAGGVYAAPMAEFAVGALLGIYKEWAYFRDSQASHRWEKHRGLRELYGKRICIIGCGQVGNACAERLGAFGCTVCGLAPRPRRDSRYHIMLPMDALPSVLGEADAVILALPLTRESRHMLGRRELFSLREGCVLINLSRGGIVDTGALSEVLGTRRIYAVLDVQETEPLPPDSVLWDMENVFLSPHNSFVGEGNADRLWTIIRDHLEADGRLT